MSEHPFAQFIRIIGRGPNLSRPLNEDEMYEAAGMILTGGVDPHQLGAFLCILRMRTEVPSEGAGFVRAVRDTLVVPESAPEVDVDWATYSGKKRQLPWFLLSALLLAQNGISICMQGTEGHTEGRLFSSEALIKLGIPHAGSLGEAAEHIRTTNFAYIALKNFMPRLQDVIELKSILGVRSPINTFARMINPFGATHEMQTVFHPNYRDVHRDTAAALGQKHMAVFKGEGGEAERRPHKPVLVQYLHNGQKSEELWPAMIDEKAFAKDDIMDLNRLPRIWAGTEENVYAAAAAVGTAAYVLRLMNRAANPGDAVAQADALWNARNKSRMFAAA